MNGMAPAHANMIEHTSSDQLDSFPPPSLGTNEKIRSSQKLVFQKNEIGEHIQRIPKF